MARTPTSMALCAILLSTPPMLRKSSESAAYEMKAAVRKSNPTTKASTVRRNTPAKYPDLKSLIKPASPRATNM